MTKFYAYAIDIKEDDWYTYFMVLSEPGRAVKDILRDGEFPSEARVRRIVDDTEFITLLPLVDMLSKPNLVNDDEVIFQDTILTWCDDNS